MLDSDMGEELWVQDVSSNILMSDISRCPKYNTLSRENRVIVKSG